MTKKLLKERLQELAGIKPLYEIIPEEEFTPHTRDADDERRAVAQKDREAKQYGYDFNTKKYNTSLPSYEGKTATHKIFKKTELAGLFVYVDPSAKPEGHYGLLPATIVGSSRYRKDHTEWNQKARAPIGSLGLDTREFKDELDGKLPEDLGKTVMVSKKFLKTDWTNHPI